MTRCRCAAPRASRGGTLRGTVFLRNRS